MSNKNTPYTYEEVKEYVEKFGYELLSKEYKNANSHIIIKCPNNHKPYPVTFSAFKNNGSRCPYCTGRLTTKEKSVGFLYPQIAKMLVEDKRNKLSYEDTYLIAPNTHKSYYFICPNCNKESVRKRRLRDIIANNHSCSYCSDGISVPEKFLTNLLEKLNIEFVTQYNTEWTNGKRYDFYIPKLNTIIETHGSQHYNESMGKWTKLDFQQENDYCKKELALKNGIKNYIVIDCSHSEFEWLKENTTRELSDIFNLKDVDWTNIWKESQRSLVFKACELWNNDLCVLDIANELKLSSTTIRKYLKNGNILNICNYTPKEGERRGKRKTSGKNNSSARSVICLTTKEIFLTMKDGAEKYGIKSTGAIPACCKGFVIRKGKRERIKSVGKSSDGKPLVWRYIIWNHNKKYRIKKMR